MYYKVVCGVRVVYMMSGVPLVDSCNGGQAMTARGWLQGALEAMDVGYGQRGKALGKAVGERREVTP